MKKVALFDFCETLVDIQTADAFIGFALEKSHRNGGFYIYRLLKSRFICRLLNKLFFDVNLKKLYIRLLAGLSAQEVDYLSKEYNSWLCSHHIINEIFGKLKRLKQNNHEIWIVSAGYGCYLRHFFPDLIDRVIATELEIDSGFLTGNISGVDCIGNEKILRINKVNIGNSVEFTISFSDSISDLPLLKFTQTGVVVSNKISQAWAIENGFEEIIWSK